jgi:hypothetical protein
MADPAGEVGSALAVPGEGRAVTALKPLTEIRIHKSHSGFIVICGRIVGFGQTLRAAMEAAGIIVDSVRVCSIVPA